MKKMLALLLALSLTLSLVGCKKNDQPNPDPSLMPSGESTESGAVYPANAPVKGGMASIGIISTPIDTGMLRGQWMTQEITIQPEGEGSVLIVPVSAMEPGVVLTCPVIVNNAHMSVLIYRDEGSEYYASVNMSPRCKFTGNGRFSQIEYDMSSDYIACNSCGKVYPVTAIGYRDGFTSDCFPYPLTASAYTIALANEYKINRELFIWVPDDFGSRTEEDAQDLVMVIPYASFVTGLGDAMSYEVSEPDMPEDISEVISDAGGASVGTAFPE